MAFFDIIDEYLDRPSKPGFHVTLTTSLIFSASLLSSVLIAELLPEGYGVFSLISIVFPLLFWSQWVFWPNRGIKWSFFRAVVAIISFVVSMGFWNGLLEQDYTWLSIGFVSYASLMALVYYHHPPRQKEHYI